MKKVGIIGHFAFGKDFSDGQTIKTKIVTEELENTIGENEIFKLDTYNFKKKFFLLPLLLFKALQECKNIVILPAQNGLRLIAPLLLIINLLWKRTLHYIVIGGWLPTYLEGRPLLTFVLKQYKHIYVETGTMKKKLIQQGFSNIVVMPNCKPLKILSEYEVVVPSTEPYRLCTFSRVMKEKGIEDAVNAVQNVNDKFDRTAYSLDIYGPVDLNQKEWFENLKSKFPPYIRYCGIIPYWKSVETIKDYFALLFPTKFYTEGIPGTIIDAYAAGVPVIASKWESFEDIVDDGATGIGYIFDKKEDLENILVNAIGETEFINAMKCSCIEKARGYLPENAICILMQNL